MSTLSKRYATDADFREVADILFGGGAEIAKANPDGADLAARKKSERRQAQVGLASNVVGLAAGAAGTKQAYDDYSAKRRDAKGLAPKAAKVGGKLSRIKGKHAVGLAGAALGLQGLNVAGDAVANRVLARSAKDDKKIKKDIGEIQEQAGKLSRGNLTKVALHHGSKSKAGEYTKGKIKRLPDKVKTINKSADLDVKWEGEISKLNEDKRQVFGWASIVEMNGEPVVDLQGDYISIDEVEKAAYDYVHKSRKGGDMHLRDGDKPVHASDMIESLVITPEKREALGLPEDSPTGWWVGYQVNDPEVWAKVKSGERTGFSIHGRGRRS